jgi:endoglucanase
MKISSRINCSVVFLLMFLGCGQAQHRLSDKIKLNQIGFYPYGPKIAIVNDEGQNEFSIISTDGSKRFYSGKLSSPKQSLFTDSKTRVADFSDFTIPGTYVLVVPETGQSHAFEIKEKIHEAVTKAALKSYYFQRFSTSLTKAFAGKWARPFSHADANVLIHPSAASDKRPAGSTISAPRGWIDAGDYNKYIVNSGITMSTLLSAYEDFPVYFDTLDTNIPESNNALPDILDEVLWNLRWMLTMQDPNDGGVYHKCTNANFDGMVMPHRATSARYVVQKSTAAALDFCAVMAQASRVFSKFEQHLPGLKDSCMNAALHAWQWASKNPDVAYNQTAINKKFDPDITTGEYGDRSFGDEFIWAVSELFATSGDTKFLKAVDIFPDDLESVPSWSQVRLLGYYSLLRTNPVNVNDTLKHEIRKRLIRLADSLITNIDKRCYQTVMGHSASDFIWGSNAVAGNQSILLIHAYRITKDPRYLTHSLSNLDYLLGRNATGYSFLTGYGDKTPMHIHHRPSEADGIVEPVPGLLAGGPNQGKQDGCKYASSVPDEAYVDDVCSYASNEVAINWNAPFVYLGSAAEVFFGKIEKQK